MRTGGAKRFILCLPASDFYKASKIPRRELRLSFSLEKGVARTRVNAPMARFPFVLPFLRLDVARSALSRRAFLGICSRAGRHDDDVKHIVLWVATARIARSCERGFPISRLKQSCALSLFQSTQWWIQ